MMRRVPLKRGTPMPRGKPMARQTKRLPFVAKDRVAEKAKYGISKREHMIAHPYCQIWIARRGLDEALVIANDGFIGHDFVAPRATQIHHRNKSRGERLFDPRWLMSACDYEHDYVEHNRLWARAEGFLLPLEADENGITPDGTQHLTTEQLMAKKPCLARAESSSSAQAGNSPGQSTRK